MDQTVAFWAFLAVFIVAVSWRKIATRREIETTIRLALEKGQQLDPVLIEKMLQTRRDPGVNRLLLGGAVVSAVGLGLPIAGYFFERSGEPGAFDEMTGWGILVLLVGLAVLLVWLLGGRRRPESRTEPPLAQGHR